MAGPVYRAIGTLAASASAATLSPALPTVDSNANGALFAVVCSKNNAVHATATPGWTLVNQTNSGASFTASLWKAAQGAAAPTFTWTGAAACSAQIDYYTDPQNTIDVVGIALLGAVGSGTTATHATAGANTSANNILALYFDVSAANTAIATPAGWTEQNDAGSATSATRHANGDKAVATSGSASGAISVSGANAAWVQWQVQLKSTAPTAGLQVDKVEAGLWVEPPAGLDVAKIEAGLWMEPTALQVAKVEAGLWMEPTEFRIAKVEVGLWLEAGAGLQTTGRRMSLM